MGQSVKFVSRINGSFSPKKNRFFFFGKKQNGGGGGPGPGAGGFWQKATIFPFFFLRNPYLNNIYMLMVICHCIDRGV